MSDADKKLKIITVFFALGLFFLQEMFLLSVMSYTALSDRVEEVADSCPDGFSTLTLILIAGPWAAIGMSTLTALYLSHKKRFALACIIALAPIVAGVIANQLAFITLPRF